MDEYDITAAPEGERVRVRFQSVHGGESERVGSVDRSDSGGLILDADRPQRYRIAPRGGVYVLAGHSDRRVGREARVEPVPAAKDAEGGGGDE